MSLLIDFARVLEGFKAHSMPSAHRLVMALYANHAGGKDHAFPSLACLSDETGIGKTKLVEVVAELVAFGWLVPDGFVGEGLRRSARYKVRLDGKPWPEDSRAKGARSTARALASRIAARSPCVPPGETLADRPAVGSCTADPGSADRPAVTNLPVTHQINPPDQPTISPALARVRGVDQADRPAFGPSEEAAEVEKPKPARRRKRDPSAPKAADLYAAAYVQGHADAGGAITPLPGSARALLGIIACAHAKRGGVPLQGAELVAWFREVGRDFRRAVPDPSRHRGAYTAHGLQTWLDGGRFKQKIFGRAEVDDFARPLDSENWPEATLTPAAVYRPPPVEPKPEETPEGAARLAELRSLPVDELNRRIEEAHRRGGVAGWERLS